MGCFRLNTQWAPVSSTVEAGSEEKMDCDSDELLMC